MKPDTLVIAVTNEYDPEYKVERQPERVWRMSLKQIERLVDEAAGMGVRLIVFGGGEPFLLGDKLDRAVQYAAFRVPAVRVVTDCYWADAPQKAMLRLARLFQSGLTEIDIRYSDWNQEPKWQQWAKWATIAAQKIGFVVFTSHFMDRTNNGLQLAHLRQSPSRLRESFGDALESGELQSQYRPVSLLPYDPQASEGPTADELLALQKVGRGHCPYIFNSLTAHPDGRLTACSGHGCAASGDLNLGDWFTSPISDLVEAGYARPLLQWIRLSGPAAIRRRVEESSPEIEFRQSYASLCHLCSDLLTRYETRRVVHEHALAEARHAISRKQEHLNALENLLAGPGNGSGVTPEGQAVA